VHEALLEGLDIACIHLSQKANGEIIQEIKSLANAKGIKIEITTDNRISALSKSGQHQGIVADLKVQRMQSLPHFLSERNGRKHQTYVVVLDGVHNPANVGMIIRTVAAAGLDGIIVPDKGTAKINPVTIKASAGTVFKAPILRVDTTSNAIDQLIENRFEIFGLETSGESIYQVELPERMALVLGNESSGLNKETIGKLSKTIAIPLANNIESLNVAASAAIASYEIVRRSLAI
jgi:23S rRNA (guanosine2251-2'-O)-methyltransferase